MVNTKNDQKTDQNGLYHHSSKFAPCEWAAATCDDDRTERAHRDDHRLDRVVGPDRHRVAVGPDAVALPMAAQRRLVLRLVLARYKWVKINSKEFQMFPKKSETYVLASGAAAVAEAACVVPGKPGDWIR